MKMKINNLKYLIICLVITFCLLLIGIFGYFDDKNSLYEDGYLVINDAKLSYPFFNDKKDDHISEYINVIDTEKIDDVTYLVNFLGEYTNVIFRLYKDDLVVDYYSALFDKENNLIEFDQVINKIDDFNKKIELYIEVNNINITMDEYNYAKKSYLFKDYEMEIYISNYNEDKTISLINLNYSELDNNLIIPHKTDKKYELMTPSGKDEVVSPIIREDELEPKKLIAFTFDDGPSKYTTELLDVLDSFNANATFFLVGYNVKLRNSIVLDMYNRGYEIGNHTIDHSRLTKFNCEKSNEKYLENEVLVEQITNEKMRLVRPPYGAINDKLEACTDYPIIFWSVDSRDWELRNTDLIVTEVLSNLKEGDIVLFHDLYDTTIDAIKILLPILYADGYKVVSVSELFAAKNIPLESKKIYRKAG